MDSTAEKTPEKCTLSFNRPTDDTLSILFSGSWKIRMGIPPINNLQNEIESNPNIKQIVIDTQEITDWDSGLLTFLIKANDYCSQKNITINTAGLPEGVKRLLEIATAVPEKETHTEKVPDPLLSRVGAQTIEVVHASREILDFIGEASLALLKFLVGKARCEASLALLRFLVGKARFRRSDLGLIIQDCGAQALPIVSLISFLVGLILAFMGAVQLKLFGAQIYVADMVGIAMVREMGAMMTGIIMAGRTGASFAAQLGTMQVNEEIDALTTLGISPMEFLVLPRMLALILMMPLLTLYSNLMGILGGFLVGVGMLDLTPMQYFQETRVAVDLTNISLGVFKSVVYGIMIALAGCLRGMQCGRSASAVGAAATSAVVSAIVLIVVSCGLFAILTNALGI
jgi:phospholipid/cholesterol/gamma-HCH transport system permease protein